MTRVTVSGGSSVRQRGSIRPQIKAVIEWDMSLNVFPSGSQSGQDYNGVNGPTTTLLDVNGDPIPNKVLIKSLKDNASTTNASEWAITYTIN